MATENYRRKISAILSAVVVGYSRLMGDNEAATVRTLKAYQETIAIIIKKHRSRIIDSPGDNLLSEFASIVDSIQCAVKIQQVIKAMSVCTKAIPSQHTRVFHKGYRTLGGIPAVWMAGQNDCS